MHFHTFYDTISIDIKYSDSLFPFIRETSHEKVTCYCNQRKAICMTALQKYFPLIKSREELVKTIQENKELNVEKVMEMFSKELKELDQNTVQPMIDEMQEEIDSQKRALSSEDAELESKDVEIESQKKELISKDEKLASKDVELETQKKELESKDNRIRELEEKLKAFTKEMV